MYVHSIPNNNDNQDIVSMGTNSATITRKVIENTFEVMAIEALTIVQAIDILCIKDKISPTAQKWYQQIRNIVLFFKDDIVPYPYLQEIKEFLKKNKN